MSWFGPVSVAKISPKMAFYFLTEERISNGFFKISGHDSIVVSNPDIKDMPSSGKVFAVPKDIIDKLQPAKHFVVKMKLAVGRNTHNFGEFPLSEILTDSVWKYHGDPKFLTRALFSCGEPCMDLGGSIVVLSCGKVIPKFSDEKAWDKLTKALNDAFNQIDRYTWPEFTIEAPKKEGDDTDRIVVTVSISLSKEIKDVMTGKHVGTFIVPEEPKEEPKEEEKKPEEEKKD